ncbi:MAG: 5-formyltetrahydrofolate cyclo-ligase [Fuerstiella sp.]|nr:5-formyltetrahydrofolate cyclo-ligase [Fuerstiella sp.]
MPPTDIRKLKSQIRRTARSRRDDQQHKDELSDRIVGAFMSLPEYATASTVMFYIDARSEVRTHQSLPDALESDKTIIVPWCNDRGELELFHLEGMDELEIGKYRIPEPRNDLRALSEKQVCVKELDVIMVPGTGFDTRGARIGSGKGYYDKLLKQVRTDTQLIALAFECQMFDEIPIADHDVLMDKVITEDRIYLTHGR